MMRHLAPLTLLAGFLMLGPNSPQAEQPTSQPDQPKEVQPNPTDVASINAIVDAFYALESGPVGQKRDWDRYRALFIPDARLVPIRETPGEPMSTLFVSLDDYVKGERSYIEARGFYGRDINRVIERYHSIAHVFSTYEYRAGSPDAPIDYRGIASIQLCFDGSRWWIINVCWNKEMLNDPIPTKYLPDAGG